MGIVMLKPVVLSIVDFGSRAVSGGRQEQGTMASKSASSRLSKNTNLIHSGGQNGVVWHLLSPHPPPHPSTPPLTAAVLLRSTVSFPRQKYVHAPSDH